MSPWCGLWIGLGSDHTDSKAETFGITLSKQLCDKPIATTFWRFGDINDHWDAIVLRAYITNGGKRELYQEGTLAKMLTVGRALKEEDGAGAVVMVCAGMARHRKPLEDALGIPVIDPTQAAVTMALGAVQFGAS